MKPIAKLMKQNFGVPQNMNLLVAYTTYIVRST